MLNTIILQKWHAVLRNVHLFIWAHGGTWIIIAQMHNVDTALTSPHPQCRVGNWSPAMGRGTDSRNRVWNWVAKLHRLAGRYDNPMPTWFLAPIAGLKLSTLEFFNNLSIRARNRVGIGLLYRSAKLHRLVGLIPWNQFLGSLKV
jgi:hypothetical protein